MKISGLHLLLTYKCVFECDHCFVWSGPNRRETMSLEMIRLLLEQARETEEIKSIYFEGGEPFLYYPILLEGVKLAASQGFKTGIVSNAYWASNPEDAATWLRPLAGLLSDLTVSDDVHHSGEKKYLNPTFAAQAAASLKIPFGRLSVASVSKPGGDSAAEDGSTLMYRGRAAKILAPAAQAYPAAQFTVCPYEDLVDPGRLHLDPLGNVFICQGISLGNVFKTPLKSIFRDYSPEANPILGPLLRGGPFELARHYDAAADGQYADACHLCYETRKSLAHKYPEILTPPGVYGEQGPE